MKLGGFPERIWRSRRARIAALLVVGFLLATNRRTNPPQPPPEPGFGVMAVAPVALDDADPARRDVGRLHFLAGWALSSDDLRFGGLSAMHVEAGEVTAISDVGVLTRFAIPGRAGRERVRFDPLMEGPGPRTQKSSRDTEGMMIEGRQVWITYEHHNAIWRYRRETWTPISDSKPAAMRGWAGNSGPEAIVRLANGRMLVFGEGRDNGQPYSDAILFDGDASRPGTPSRTLRYQRPEGFRATDAALLPDGRLLVLNRRFRLFEGWTARLVIAGLRRDGVIATREIAALAAPLTVDNMEAMSVTSEGGRTIVWLASDDNFSPLQRTLLLKFELRE
jgi:hypothetical protein